jgi:hypothetical protein
MHMKFQSENLKGKRSLGKPKCRWEDNTKMDIDLEEIWC